MLYAGALRITSELDRNALQLRRNATQNLHS